MVPGIECKYSSLKPSTVFSRGTDNTGHAFHNFVMIDVGKVSHLECMALTVVHLIIYKVVPRFLHLNDARTVVRDATFPVTSLVSWVPISKPEVFFSCN